MRIAYLGLAIPNMNEAHNMFSDLVVEFHKNGHEIIVVAPAFDENRTGLLLEDGIQVIRVPTMKLFNVGKFQKGLANLLLPYQYKKALKKSGVDLNFDLVIMPTPPITLTDLASWFKKKYKSKVYLILRDIFPQNAVDLGMMRKGGPAYFFFRRKEKKMYRTSDAIGCMSQGNIDYVIKHNPQLKREKLHLLPNWGRLMPLISNDEKLKIKRKYGVQDKFIVMFGGNIGKPQKMENVVALAKACEEIRDIFFLIIGGGNEKSNLENSIASEKLGNVMLKGYLTKEDYFKVLQIADVGLISLSEVFTIPNYPSKSLVYFNAKKPILASVDVNTDFGTNLEKINAGLWEEAGKTEEVKKKLLELYHDADKRKMMGQNGYDYMKKELLTPFAYNTIMTQYKQ